MQNRNSSLKLIISPPNQHSQVLELRGNDLVEVLRGAVEALVGISAHSFFLSVGSKQLQDGRFLSDYLEIRDGCIVNVILTCLGGMKSGKKRKPLVIKNLLF